MPGNSDTTDQDYALVVSDATPSTGPVLTEDHTTATEVGDGDGFIEPGEQFDLTERLRNTGDRHGHRGLRRRLPGCPAGHGPTAELGLSEHPG